MLTQVVLLPAPNHSFTSEKLVLHRVSMPTSVSLSRSSYLHKQSHDKSLYYHIYVQYVDQWYRNDPAKKLRLSSVAKQRVIAVHKLSVRINIHRREQKAQKSSYKKVDPVCNSSQTTLLHIQGLALLDILWSSHYYARQQLKLSTLLAFCGSRFDPISSHIVLKGASKRPYN